MSQPNQPGQPHLGNQPYLSYPTSSSTPPGTPNPAGDTTDAAAVKKRGCLAGLFLLGVLLFAGVMVTIVVTIGIWPGEAKLTAPLFCPDGKPDPYVVTDSYTDADGTSYNFTLYCMGPRGDVVDKGFFKPFVVLTLAHMALIVAAIVAFAVLVRIRRAASGSADDGPTSFAPS